MTDKIREEELIVRTFPKIPKVPSQVLRLLKPLPKRLQAVVILLRGFDRQESRTLEEVGRHFGVTRERIRQLYQEALNKLAKVSKEDDLIVYIPLYSCKCGKYQGIRYKGIWCDKCGTKLIYRGNRMFNFGENSAERQYSKLLSAIFQTWLRKDDVYQSIDGCTLAQALQEAMDSISTVERARYWPSFIAQYKRVLILRFGLEDGKCRTLEEVGREFSLSKERIRQIEAKVLRLLRHPSRSRKLKAYIRKEITAFWGRTLSNLTPLSPSPLKERGETPLFSPVII